MKIVGYAGSMQGNDLFIQTIDGEIITMNIKNKNLRWKLYCKNLTIETS